MLWIDDDDEMRNDLEVGVLFIEIVCVFGSLVLFEMEEVVRVNFYVTAAAATLSSRCATVVVWVFVWCGSVVLNEVDIVMCGVLFCF